MERKTCPRCGKSLSYKYWFFGWKYTDKCLNYYCLNYDDQAHGDYIWRLWDFDRMAGKVK